MGKIALLSGWAALLLAQASFLTFDQATALVRDGKAAEALPSIERLATDSPNDLRVRNLLGIALSTLGRREEAVGQFKKVLDANPKFLPAVKNLALNEVELGRYADARPRLETVLAASPNDPAAVVAMAQVEFSEHKSAAVAARLEHFPGGAPPSLHFSAGLLLTEVNQFAAAAREFTLSDGGAPPYSVGFNLTLAYFNAQNYGAAIDAGKKLVSGGLATTELYEVLAKAYEAAGQTKDAYDSLRAATQLDPKDEAPYLDLIALCVEHQNYELSLEIADVGIRVSPSAFRIRVDRGVVLALKGQMQEAEREFAAAAEVAPTETTPQVSRAIALIELNRISEAIDLLRARRAQRDDSYLVDWHLAEALLKAGDDHNSEAVDALRKSIVLNASVPRTHFLLGKLLLQSGKTEEGMRELETVLRLDPSDVSAMYQLAQGYRKQGNAARANELFAKVTEAKAEASEQKGAHSGLLRIVRDGSN